MNLKINDKEYPLQFGLGAVELYCEKMDCDIDDIDTHVFSEKTITQIKALNTMALCALQNGCEIAGIPFNLTYRQFQLWLQDQPQEIATDIMNEWIKVTAPKTNMSDGTVADPEAKKVSKKK